MPLVVGVDGGGSRTRARVAGADGRVLGEGTGGPANWRTAGEAVALESVRAAVAAALRAAGVEPGQVQAACFGLAGAARPPGTGFAAALGALLPGARLRVTHDAAIALAGAAGDGPGCVILAGTGAVTYGRDGRGSEARAGGWGWLAGDEGSGFDIGRQALAAALRAHDGRGPQTALLPHLLRAWQAADVDGLVDRMLRQPVDRPAIAGLAREVGVAAAGGDAVAQAILAGAAGALADAAGAVLARLGLRDRPVPVATVGGLFALGPAIRRPLAERLAATAPGACLTLPRGEPVQGAVELALALLRPG